MVALGVWARRATRTALLCAPSPLPRVLPANVTVLERVTDGARTRDLLLSHNPMSYVTVRPTASGNWAYLWGFRLLCRERLSAAY
jgi:hypothetical protein